MNGKTATLPGTAFFKRDQEFLRLLKVTLDQNYPKPDFNLRKMSRQMRVSERQIQRKMKVLMGCTPSEYVRTFRLKKSLLLLRRGVPVKDASRAVGFSSQSYFATCFKTQFGRTPTEYQREQALLLT